MAMTTNQHDLLKPVRGFSCIESGNPDHVWAIERIAELAVPDVPADVDSVVFSFKLSTLNARIVRVVQPDGQEELVDLSPGQPRTVKLHIRPISAKGVVKFETAQDGVKPRGDERTLFFDMGNASAHFVQNAKSKTIDELKEKITLDIAREPVLGQIRAFNHVMIADLEKVCPLSGCSILDVGGSVHGFALEAALDRKKVVYEGINLGVAEAWDSLVVEFAGYYDSVGYLRHMNAEALDFPDQTFDCLLSVSTFEHFLHPGVVLAEMHRVLRRGGVALIHFDGVWSCSYGYHLLQFGKITDRVAPWSHLFLSKERMREVLERKPWPADAPITLPEALRWIYDDTDLNRLSIRELRKVFERSAFDIIQNTPLMDENLEGYRPVAEYLSRVLPLTAEELLTRGQSILLKKR